MLYKNEQKRATKFYCKFCDYSTSRKNNWERHVTTLKHLNATKCYKKRASTFALHVCRDCGKNYKHISSFYRHKKTCQSTLNQINIKKELEKKCEKLENEIVELKSTTNNIINYNNINITVFLDNHYRNAMNLTEFVNQINLSIEDLIYTRNNGYINGISKILMSNLNKLEQNERPIQCLKPGSTFYVKEENKWAEDQGNIDRGINSINKKQIQKVQSMINNSNNNDIYVEMVKEITTGNSSMDNEKIKKNIEKNTLLIK